MGNQGDSTPVTGILTMKSNPQDPSRETIQYLVLNQTFQIEAGQTYQMVLSIETVSEFPSGVPVQATISDEFTGGYDSNEYYNTSSQTLMMTNNQIMMVVTAQNQTANNRVAHTLIHCFITAGLSGFEQFPDVLCCLEYKAQVI